MEGIFIFIAFIIGITLVRFAIGWIFSSVLKLGGAAVQTVSGTGRSFTENVSLQFRGMGLFEIRVREEQLGEESEQYPVFVVEGQGLIPVQRTTKIGFVTSIIDITDGEDRPQPVLSLADVFQEPETTAFMHIVPGQSVEPQQGFLGWTRLGCIVHECIHPPKGGTRKLKILLRIIDLDSKPSIRLGYSQNSSGIICTSSADENFYFKSKGYLDEMEDRDKAKSLSIQLAVAVAMSDGFFDESEGLVIKAWIKRQIESFSDERRESIKDSCNRSLKSAYADAKAGNLAVSRITNAMNEVGSDGDKYKAMELCFSVMSADGHADQNELNIIRKIASSMDLDFDEINNMQDKAIVDLGGSIESSSIEAILGIDEGWPKSQIQSHIRTEFAKWNSRYNSLEEGKERENAQSMLDLLAKARAKYS